MLVSARLRAPADPPCAAPCGGHWLFGKEASEGSGWAAALLLGVSFGEDDDGNARMCDCDAHDRSGRSHVLHVAVVRGDADIVSLLSRAGADVEVGDGDGNTPLLLACRAGHLELAQVLVDKGADASAANEQGDTPLLAAVAAGNAQLARELVEAGGANVEASREDGANVLVLAILSKNEACIKFALTRGPKRLQGQDTLDGRAFVQREAEAFSDPAQIGVWIRDGATARALMAEIGALLSSADLSAAVKPQLEDVLAFLDHHQDVLGDPSCWPVPAEQLVAQLASQEPDATFACVEAGAVDTASKKFLITWKNKPQARRRCRRTHKAGEEVLAVAVAPDGSRLAYAAGGTVVVRNFQTGLVVWQLTGHQRVVSSVHFSPDGKRLVSGSWDNTVMVWDPSTGEQLCQLRGHTDCVKSVCFSPDGTKLVTGSWDETVKIWNPTTGEELCELRGQSGIVTAVKFASQDMVASSSTDGSTKLWNLKTGEETAEAVPEGFTFPPQGRGAQQQRINSYVVAAKGQTVVIHKAPQDKAETAADGKAGTETETSVAFFQCDDQINAFDVAGANVAVGCACGQVLQLFAAVLHTRV